MGQSTVDGLEARLERVKEMVGNTPVVELELPGVDPRVVVKLEGANPTGSVKDRACLSIVRSALRTGELTRDHVLLDASSGNFACSMAFLGKVLGLGTEVVTNSKLTLEKRRYCELFDARLIEHGEFTAEGTELCRRKVEREPDRYFFLDQLHNDRNPLAHEETTGPELLDQVPAMGAIAMSMGSGGTLLGVSRAVKRALPSVRILAVESASGSRIPGTGSFSDGDYETPFIKQAMADGSVDLRVQVSEEDALQGSRLLRERGVFAGLQTGGLATAVRRAGHLLQPGEQFVLISGDAGWKNLDRFAAA